MIRFYTQIIKWLYKPTLVLLLLCCVYLLLYVPKEEYTVNPMWIEITADRNKQKCEISVWDGGRLAYSLSSDTRNDLYNGFCQMYIIRH